MKLEVELAAMKRKFAEKEEIEIELKNQLQKQTNLVKKMNDESHLAFEENKLLKHQVSALLEGGLCCLSFFLFFLSILFLFKCYESIDFNMHSYYYMHDQDPIKEE